MVRFYTYGIYIGYDEGLVVKYLSVDGKNILKEDTKILARKMAIGEYLG